MTMESRKEKVLEIAKRAGFVVDIGGHGDRNADLHYNLDRFTELIVKECANYINERTLDWDANLRWIFNDGSGDMAVDVDDLLNRHFGVEE